MRKTTKNGWGKMLFAGMLSMVLVFGLVLPSCDDGSSGGSTYDGTYIYSEGNQKLILSAIKNNGKFNTEKRIKNFNTFPSTEWKSRGTQRKTERSDER